MRHRRLRDFAAPARQACAPWQTVAGALIAILSGIALVQLLIMTLTSLTAGSAQGWFTGPGPMPAVINISLFGLFAAGLAISLRAIHDRGLLSAAGSLPDALDDARRVAVPVAFLVGLVLLLPQAGGTARTPLPFGAWLLLLPLSLAAVMLQAATMEIFFRGYLAQQIAARWPEGPWWAVVPAAISALAYLPSGGPPEAAWLGLIWGGAFGLAAADLTGRTGTIGAAVALTAVVNAAGLVFVTSGASMSPLALWHAGSALQEAGVVLTAATDLTLLLVLWLAARLALRV
ncbi:type II CAAX prenyl endopeptidase Rce1 family protein [Tropicimonas sp. IMCC34011]|uniref:CPBP family glutamic-type intramembrane protease n=1 Tax=Tropicimonas sp. IMCC34011 TaxID=2248759 RepID=UPI000E22E752|nr:CPBP family glutamic-type intramembrane protease [Tropicimonas sp. IMCC34011]